MEPLLGPLLWLVDLVRGRQRVRVLVHREISGCWRTLDGAAAFLTVRSYLSTARKHGINPLAVLRQLFEGRPWFRASTGS